MNSILLFVKIVMANEIINFSNFTRDGILRVAFNPYLEIFGNYLWGIIFGFIGVAIYANEQSIGTATIYLILVGVFMAVIFPSALAGILGLITAFLIAVIFFKAFIQS